MISTPIRWTYLFPLLFLILSSFCFAQEELLPYPGIIHLHSNITQGAVYSPRRLVSLAQDKGIKILVFTDSFLRRWEYGLPILSNIFKVSVEERSIVKYGIKRYLEDLGKLKNEFSDTLILEGMEVTPFYWWSGNPFKKNLSLNDWNRQLLVVGLKKRQDYMHLPVICSRYFLPRLKDIPFLLIPIALIFLGTFLLKKRKERKLLGCTLVVAAILFFFNLFPFSTSQYNPYQGQKQFLPYQDLINYVNKKGGLVFWSLPEIIKLASWGQFAGVGFYTSSYPEALIQTSGYTGFGINMHPGTSHNVILAGREWDNVLISYCEGRRNQPVWVIAEADYRGEGSIDSVQNIFFLPEFTDKSVYEALRKGRIYTRYYSENKIDITLDDFHIEDSKNPAGKPAFIADEIEIKGKPRLHIKGNYMINPPEELKLEIIRDGEIIKEFRLNEKGIFDLEFQDDFLKAPGKRIYYRLNFFAGAKVILVTNPIFVDN